MKMKNASREMLFVVLSFILMLLVIVLTSVAHAGLNPARIFTVETLSNVILNAVITIFGTVASLPAGIATTKNRRGADGSKGRYLQEFFLYNTIRQQIEPRRQLFAQWHYQQYLKECHDKKVSYLLERGVQQAELILHLDREQIKTLLQPQMFEIEGTEVYFKALTALQVNTCLKVCDGKVTVRKLSDYYFLYANGKGNKSFYDQAYDETRDENTALISNLIVRIFTGFMTTCILTGLVVDVMQDANVLQICINMVVRILGAVMSTAWGFLLGQEHVYKLCYYLNGRTQFLQAFDADRSFVAVSVEDEAKLEYDTLNQKEVSDGTGSGCEGEAESTGSVLA